MQRRTLFAVLTILVMLSGAVSSIVCGAACMPDSHSAGQCCAHQAAHCKPGAMLHDAARCGHPVQQAQDSASPSQTAPAVAMTSASVAIVHAAGTAASRASHDAESYRGAPSAFTPPLRI